MSIKGNIGLKAVVNASARQIFDYLVKPDLLTKWFCDSAELEPHTGGRIKFGGPHSFMSSFIESEGIGQIEVYDPPRRLEFSFLCNGAHSSIEYQLTAFDDKTEIKMIQKNIPRESLMMDGLIVCLSNLINVVEKQNEPYRLNYLTDIQDETIQREIIVNGSAEKVFKALIDKNELSLWFSDHIEKVEPRVGGVYDVGWRDGKGRQMGPGTITDIQENRLLSYSWNLKANDGNQARWELIPLKDKTKVRLVHEGFKPGRYNKDYVQGWHAYMLTLKEYIEKGQRPFEIIEGDWNY